jgi:hypothetical protein
MSWTNFGKSLVFATIVAEVVLYYVERYKKYCKRSSGYLNEVMFFTDKSVDCKEHSRMMLSCNKECCSYFNMRYMSAKLLLYFNYFALYSQTTEV